MNTDNLSVDIPKMSIPFEEILHFLIKEITDKFAQETLSQIERHTQTIKEVLSQKSELQNDLIKALQNNKDIYNSFVELQGKYKALLVKHENILAQNKELLDKYQILAEEKRKLEALNNVRNKK